MALNSVSKPTEFCLRIAEMLDNNPAAPRNVMQETSVLNRITAPDNVAGWDIASVTDLAGKQVPTGAEGVVAKMYLEYEKPLCKGGESSSDKLCDITTGATADPKGYLELTINKSAERHFVVTKAEFAALCETPDMRVADKLRRIAFEIKHEMNTELIKYLHGISGNYYDGTASLGETAKTVTIIDNNGNIVNAGYTKILKEYRKVGFKGQVLNFGGDTLASYVDARGLQGMSMNSVGANVDPLSVMPFTYDNSFDLEFQLLEEDEDSHGVTVPLGGVHMQEYFLHTGVNIETQHPEITRMKMLIDGVTYDYGMKYDPCGGADKMGAWVVQLKKHYGFASIPAAAYCDSKGLNFHWKYSCGDFSCASM